MSSVARHCDNAFSICEVTICISAKRIHLFSADANIFAELLDVLCAYL
jgi:hypothetical protein